MSEFDVEKNKERSEKSAEFMARLMKESHERKLKFINILVPLLKSETIRQIVAEEKEFYDFYEKKAPPDQNLLREHLINLIRDFDCNIHYLEESEIPALAETINQKPLISFFRP